eukprot:5819544-Pyramimonas_sp.AAC.1
MVWLSRLGLRSPPQGGKAQAPARGRRCPPPPSGPSEHTLAQAAPTPRTVPASIYTRRGTSPHSQRKRTCGATEGIQKHSCGATEGIQKHSPWTVGRTLDVVGQGMTHDTK